MRISTISYQRKRADGAYGNRSLHVTAELAEDDDPSAVALQLWTFVSGELDREEQADAERRARARERVQQRARLPGDEEDDENGDEDDDDDGDPGDEDALPF